MKKARERTDNAADVTSIVGGNLSLLVGAVVDDVTAGRLTIESMRQRDRVLIEYTR